MRMQSTKEAGRQNLRVEILNISGIVHISTAIILIIQFPERTRIRSLRINKKQSERLKCDKSEETPCTRNADMHTGSPHP